MSQSKIQQRSSDSVQELRADTFMSATELRDYVKQTEMAKASKDVGSGRADKTRAELIRSLLQPVAVDWPQGLPGDIGFFLTWDDAKR